MPDEETTTTGTAEANGQKPRQFTPNAQLAITGRLTRDPEAKTSARGHPYTRARIATNLTPARNDGGSEEILFLDVVAFRGEGAALAKCSKGNRVHLMGVLEMKTRASDGQRYQNFTITADAVMGAATTRRTE